MEKGLRYLSHMFLTMDPHLEYKNVIVVIFHIYIYKENLTKFTIENMFTFQNSYFCWKKNLIKTHFFNKLVCLQLLAKYLCNLSSFDKVGLHHNKNNLVIHNFLHFFFFFFFLYFLELHVLSIALESLIFDHML